MKLLWTPPEDRIKSSNMQRFIGQVNQKYSQNIENYPQLYDWSVANISDFWSLLWDFADIHCSQPYTQVLQNAPHMMDTQWFVGSRLNFAENLLRYRDDKIALVFQGENCPLRKISYAELYAQVAQLAQSLRNIGVQKGDRVAGFMPNMIETVVAMLATASIGALWSSCSPDFGIKGVLDRFGQIQPKVLFTANEYSYGGKKHNSLERVQQILEDLPSVETVVVVPYAEKTELGNISQAVHYHDFLESSNEVQFTQLPFSHPLYIMYSSGTTGLPKCMVQSAGGILVNHLKEHILQVDLKREDTIFYFTTCGWMMWNWLVSALGVGATVVLYDGSPFYPNKTSLWDLVDAVGINIFGTSPRYLAACEKEGVVPKNSNSLATLKTVLSTGAPLTGDGFQYIYQQVKSDVHLASISGGTDLNGCFVAGNPISPVYEGQIQGRCLAMDIAAYDENGVSVVGKKGELVCRSPFPSMPLYFWQDEEKQKYHQAYYNKYENIWCHGDYIEILENGGIVIYGRSDATLNPGGVRIGTAEIYRQVETLSEINDSIVVGQDWQDDVRVILFVKMAEGQSLTDEVRQKIKYVIRKNASPRHVPAQIIEVADIPYTISLKKVELAVREIIHGRPVLNKDALKNPEALELYKNLPDLERQ